MKTKRFKKKYAQIFFFHKMNKTKSQMIKKDYDFKNIQIV